MDGQARTALISAFDKAPARHVAGVLKNAGWNILGSEGTVKYLKEKAALGARDIAEIVGSPILGHRVVTLSREIHAALLAKETPEDVAELVRIGIPRIDLVYVSFYPLEKEVKREGATLESVIEKTDIGGPTLLRSAAKGRRLVICRESEIDPVLDYVMAPGKLDRDQQFISWLVSIAEGAVSDYCSISARYHREHAGSRYS